MKRYVCHQNLREVANGLLSRSKNGPRALFRQTNDSGAVVEVTWADVPADGQNYAKIMSKMPEALWGIYDSRAKPEDIVANMSWKAE